MRSPSQAPPPGEAFALGVLHGPAELLPISSSGHTTLVPWLLGWRYGELDPELRKSFEVALHAGTAVALLITRRDEVDEAMHGLDGRRLALIALSCAPPALVGFTLERPIERILGTPATVAAGLLAGSAVMAWADRSPQTRGHEEADFVDALWLGVAQACALFPGVSRNGATLAAARLRCFTRVDANRLSRHAALPVIAGATLLKGVRLAGSGLAPGARTALAVGAGAAFASTLASTWLIRQVECDRSLVPYAAYRAALATAVLVRLARGRPRGGAPPVRPIRDNYLGRGWRAAGRCSTTNGRQRSPGKKQKAADDDAPRHPPERPVPARRAHRRGRNVDGLPRL